ncbi:16S rRNA (uracil(1498)-N(3))-methyltransferase [uncultured Phascolarctobacterium sp.]|uniref:16S rRNA (uracil(1498)-N(3))-methyltransferase n=1 Tax=uncultured Phascolarctobacterium sp. TaxID=512296 RepID=UPI0025FD98A4|nr:16S rRNA (uracil(1498)-N(3))-methyltransferase [uncultured Phascolarctobacterium sp.]
MHRFFIPQLYNEEMYLEGVDARHIGKVLRMQPGDKLQIVSDDGVSALAQVTSIDGERVYVRCLEKLAESHEPRVKLVLAQGLAKGEKMDFIIQKAVEMGAYSIVPVAMEHSVVRLEGVKAAKKVERWQKIAESAAKQSKRDIIPQVQPVQTMAQMLANNSCQTKIIAYECEDRLSLKAALREADAANISELLLIIGPEGGISESELEQARSAGAVPVTLGRRILRAETAGLVAISAIFYETGDLGD